MPIVCATPHEEKHAGFPHVYPHKYGNPTHTSTNGLSREGRSKTSSTLRPVPQTESPRRVWECFGSLGVLGLIVYSILWGILMNGKNSH